MVQTHPAGQLPEPRDGPGNRGISRSGNEVVRYGDDRIDPVVAGELQVALDLIRVQSGSSNLGLDQSTPPGASGLDNQHAVRSTRFLRVRHKPNFRVARNLRALPGSHIDAGQYLPNKDRGLAAKPRAEWRAFSLPVLSRRRQGRALRACRWPRSREGRCSLTVLPNRIVCVTCGRAYSYAIIPLTQTRDHPHIQCTGGRDDEFLRVPAPVSRR